MSKTTILGIFSGGFGVFLTMLNLLALCISDFGLFPIIHKMGFDPVMDYVPFRNGEEVDWSWFDLKVPVFFYR